MGGHGYTTVRASTAALDVEFICLPRPIESSDRADGGDLAYRVTHRLKHWRSGDSPQLQRTKAEGVLPLITL
jgi:alkaline phosphatase D